jgi:hypothetical protein
MNMYFSYYYDEADPNKIDFTKELSYVTYEVEAEADFEIKFYSKISDPIYY